MNDMSATIVAKSDQINAVDLIGAERTFTIRDVRIKEGDDQPVSIFFEGESKAFRPCKGVRRLLVHVWGLDASKYVGHSLTLFNDPKVTWAGKEEGGIRVSRMTGLAKKITFVMRISRAATRPYEIEPLAIEAPAAATPDHARVAENTLGHIARAPDLEKLNQFIAGRMPKLLAMQTEAPDLWQAIDDALRVRRAEFAEPEQGRADEQHGDQFDGTDDLPPNF